MIDAFNGGGPRLKIIKGTLINRTGQALTPGELVAFNTDAATSVDGQSFGGLNPSDTSTDTAGTGSLTAGYVFGNAITPTATNIKGEMAIVDNTTDGQDIPDNAPFTAIFCHPDFPVALEANSVAIGEYFRGTAAAYTGTGMTRIEIGTSTTAGEASVFRVLGRVLELGTSGRRRCSFWGGVPALGLCVGIGAS